MAGDLKFIKENEIKEIERDFSHFKSKVLGIILFGSRVNREEHERSDVDICLVAPDYNSGKLFNEIIKSRVTERYDVKIFELLPLKLKGTILENHRIIWSKDEKELSYYLHKWRRVWEDQKLSLRKLGIKIFSKYPT